MFMSSTPLIWKHQKAIEFRIKTKSLLYLVFGSLPIICDCFDFRRSKFTRCNDATLSKKKCSAPNCFHRLASNRRVEAGIQYIVWQSKTDRKSVV